MGENEITNTWREWIRRNRGTWIRSRKGQYIFRRKRIFIFKHPKPKATVWYWCKVNDLEATWWEYAFQMKPTFEEGEDFQRIPCFGLLELAQQLWNGGSVRWIMGWLASSDRLQTWILPFCEREANKPLEMSRLVLSTLSARLLNSSITGHIEWGSVERRSTF